MAGEEEGGNLREVRRSGRMVSSDTCASTYDRTGGVAASRRGADRCFALRK